MTDTAEDRRRAFVADTTALVIFFTATGILNERFVAGMDWDAVVRARLIGAPLMVLTARPYGLWRDLFLRGAGPGRRGRLLRDTAALVTFQVPIYAAIIWAGGAEGAEILRGTLGAAVLMLLLGRPYGLRLDWVRGRFGLGPGGRKPMSMDPDAP